jgi:hypothetical protein
VKKQDFPSSPPELANRTSTVIVAPQMWHVDAVLHTVHTCFFLYKVLYCDCYTHTIPGTVPLRHIWKWQWTTRKSNWFGLHGHIVMSWERSSMLS